MHAWRRERAGLVASPATYHHTVLCKSVRHGTRTRTARTTGSAGTYAVALPGAQPKQCHHVRTRCRDIRQIKHALPVALHLPSRAGFPPPQNGKPRATSGGGHAGARHAPSPSRLPAWFANATLPCCWRILPAPQKRQYSFALAARTASICRASACMHVMSTPRRFESCPEWTDQIQAKDLPGCTCTCACATESPPS